MSLTTAIAKLELQAQATKDDIVTEITSAIDAAVDAGVEAQIAMTVFDVTATLAEVNAGTKVIVPAVSDKSFWPVLAAMQAIGGAAADATLIRLIEETSSGVVLSHVVADMTENTWVGATGGTVVATLLDKPLVANKAILIDKTGSALTTCTHVRAVVMGYYITA
jgi:hypothetical protein